MEKSTLYRAENFINGSFVSGSSSKKLEVLHKYTGETLEKISFCDSKQLELAIDSAQKGHQKLKSLSAQERSELLQRIAQKLEEKKEQFIELIIAEAAKPRDYAKVEVERGIKTLLLSASEAQRFCGEMIPIDYDKGVGKTAYTKRFPLGPIIAISPFNFPLNLALHKIAPALAVGCSICLKPSPYTPLTALSLAKIVHEAGAPHGSLNVLICTNEASQKLVEDERFKLFSFTGSPQVGWMLKNKAGKKKVVLELGGNAAVYIDESADLEEASNQLIPGCYIYSGQVCISTQRIFVHEKVFETFKNIFVKKIEAISCGDPNQEGTLVGPIIDQKHLERISSWVNEAKEQGAKILVGGHILDQKHSLYAPTLLTQTSESMKVYDEEIFGPVALIEKVSTLEEGLRGINNSRFGLQAGVFTQNLSHLNHAHQELEVGGVMINQVPGTRFDNMPYGGTKDSGIGREGPQYAMRDMSEDRVLIF